MPMPQAAAQQTLPFNEVENSVPPEVLAEIKRLWIGRAHWRQRFRTMEELLADPLRRRTLEVCARGIWLNRLRRAQRAG